MPKKAGRTLSARAIAAAVGVSHTAVNGWVKHPAWKFGKGPWSSAIVEEIKAWTEKFLKAAATPGDSATASKKELDKYSLECQLLGRRILKEKVLYEKAVGQLIDRKEVEAREVRQVMAVKGELLGLKSHATRLVGLTVQQMETYLESLARRISTKFESARADE